MPLSQRARSEFAAIIVVVTFVAIVLGRTQYHKNWSAAFETIGAGDTEEVVLNKLGSPTAREMPDRLYPGYALESCIAPCAERLWYENLIPGIEAWSVSLTSERRVLETYHWVSP
ncbi:hypothetical protein GGD46_000314 [Rhizobium lusitanum]|uniref:Uncharacterized protein n=1 Tax=Rhizobium lusitanum TaxID=293958 RepID=A0A7X0IL97_9HYPH|nr:hypothetical protein [Rhizobium lusitanum]